MMGRGNELGVRLGCGLFFLVLGAPTAVLAQAPSRPPTDQPKHVQAPKKRLPDRAFVLVGAGDIASCQDPEGAQATDRKSTRLNSSHLVISYAVFCLKKKT